VLSEANDSIDILFSSANFGVLGLVGSRLIGWERLASDFVSGDFDGGGVTGCGFLRIFSGPFLRSLLATWPFWATTSDFSFAFSGWAFFAGRELGDPGLDGDLGLRRDEDVLDDALVLDDAADDREGFESRRERLSIALIASVLDPFDSDMSDW
jgi:hypothetical protein